MKLSSFSVNRPIAILMVILAVVMIGAVSLSGLHVDLMPDFEFPVAIVVTSYGSVAPQEVENMISRPLEDVLGTVSNVSSISSISSEGSSIVIVQFEMGTDMDFATLDMIEKIDMARDFLPAGAGDPMVLQMDMNLMPVLILGISGDSPLQEIKAVTEDVIKPRLERLDGVASVSVTGGLTREIQVIVDAEKLAAHGLDLNQLVQTLQAQNMNLSVGEAVRGGQDLNLRIIGEYRSIDQIGETKLTTPVGASIRLQDVARVEDGFKDITGFSRMEGKPAIALFIQKQSGANTVAVVRAVRAALEKLQPQLSADLKISTVMDQAEYIEFAIDNVIDNLIIGGILAAVVLFVFLRSMRSTLVIGLAMPISVIATFTLIYFNGLTLNMMTLGGLALGIGMMVDCAIVVLENIFRFSEQGLERKEAAIKGADEVANAIIASTLTTVAVFFPIAFVKGIASELFTELALTVSFSLLVSLLVALTLVPMLASRILKVSAAAGSAADDGTSNNKKGFVYKVLQTTERWFKRLDEFYRRLLGWCLAHRFATVAIVLLLLLASLALVPFIGAEFIPAIDQGMIMGEIELPHGSSLEETNKVMRQVEQAFEPFLDDIDLIFTSVGGDGTGGMGAGFSGQGSSNRGSLYVTLVPLEERRRSTWEIADSVRRQVEKIPGAEITISTGDMLAGIGIISAPVEITLRGDELEQLEILSAQVADILREIEGTREVASSLEEGQPEIQLQLNMDRANAYGLTTAQIASTVRTAVEGQVATRYRTGSEEIDVRVRLSEDGRYDLSQIENLTVTSPLGLQVPLGELVEIREVKGPTAIQRKDQVRTASVTAQLDGRDLASVMAEAEAKIAENVILPPGYSIDYGGEFELMTEAFGDLFLALIMAIVLVYMVMAFQFESLLYPFVIMFSMPVAAIGVILGLFITGRTFNVVTFIGIIMLAGIVVNNAIVLVDYINILRRRGMERDEAILTAGPTRLRPILMTALTTILAMVPMAIGLGEGAELQAPMATAVIGGLTFSTFLTLVLVPVVYAIFDDLGKFSLKRKISRAKGSYN